MIRFLCALDSKRLGSWGELAAAYVLALAQIRPIKVVSVAGPIDFAFWNTIASYFVTNYDAFDYNFVCAPAGFLERLWTKGCRNIAILGGPNPRPPNIEVLAKYDEVWTAQEWCLADYYGVNTKYLPPHLDLKPFLR